MYSNNNHYYGMPQPITQTHNGFNPPPYVGQGSIGFENVGFDQPPPYTAKSSDLSHYPPYPSAYPATAPPPQPAMINYGTTNYNITQPLLPQQSGYSYPGYATGPGQSQPKIVTLTSSTPCHCKDQGMYQGGCQQIKKYGYCQGSTNGQYGNQYQAPGTYPASGYPSQAAGYGHVLVQDPRKMKKANKKKKMLKYGAAAGAGLVIGKILF